jgi:hypothetical protein
MRSVWREMRDEEPPARGMAELLAAARAQVAPKVEPGWRRVLSGIAATFRRPPVLALATVVVLVGGGLLIGRHRADIQPVATPTPGRSATSAPADASVAPPQPSTPAELREEKEVVPPPEPSITARPVVDHAPARPAPPPPVAGPKGGGGQAPDIGSSSAEGRFAEPTKPAQDSPPPDNAAESSTLDKDVAKPMSGGEIGGLDDAAPTAKQPMRPPPASPRPTPPHESSRGNTLAQQCRAAAARNDCTTTRRLAGELAKQDSTSYRSTLRDSAVAKCLNESANANTTTSE